VEIREYRQTFTPELTAWFWNLFSVLMVEAITWLSTVVPRRVNNATSVAIQNALAAPLFATMPNVTKVLTFYCNAGFRMQRRSTNLVHDILNNTKTQVLEQTHTSCLSGLSLYQNRLDKGYSLTDCISMNTMHELEITEVLTHVSEALPRNRHFTQEGFVILLRD
jgi:predicted nucleic acid-binding protein